MGEGGGLSRLERWGQTDQEVKRPREYRTKMVELQEKRSWRKGSRSPGPGRRRRFRRGVGWELLGGATGTE